MDGLSTAAGVIAVVQLTIQLVGSIQKISRFLNSFQDAPDEVRSLSESIDLLHQHLDHANLLVDRQTNLPDHCQSIKPLSDALTVCKARVDRLETIINKFQISLRSQSLIQRKWGSLKVVGKRDEIESHQIQIRDADAMLQSAILIHVALTTTEIHQQLQVTRVALARLSPQDLHIESGSGQALSSKTPSLPTKFRTVVKTDHQRIYDGIFGRITTQQRSKHLLGKCNVKSENRMTIEEEHVTQIMVPFLQSALEIRLTRSFGHVSRSLTVYSVMPYDSPVFELCRYGDIEGLQNLFIDCNISPFVQDTEGWTPLHEAAYSNHGELCAWLCKLGVDPDRRNYRGRLAIELVAGYEIFSSPHKHSSQSLKCSKALAQSLADASSDKVLNLTSWPSTSSETLELFLLQDYAGVATSIQSEYDLWNSILNFVIGKYGAQGPKWEHLARSLLRRCYPVHVTQNVRFHTGEYKSLPLLHYLFIHTETPFEAEKVGSSWLTLLSSEGYDVAAYLEEEAALYGLEPKIWSFPGDCHRQLVFKWEETMGVSWKWVNESTSPIFSLQDEFKTMINWPVKVRCLGILRVEDCKDCNDECWEAFWPFAYETQEDFISRCPKHRRDKERRRKRDIRRMEKKAAKLARPHRRKGPRRVPGAWPS